MIKRKLLRARGFLATALLPIIALAASPQAVDPAALNVDQTIQKLKSQSLDVIQQAQAIEQQLLYPNHDRLSVYIGVSIPGMLVKDIAVSIDRGALTSYQYREGESVALQDRGLHLLLRTNAAAGRHQIHAQYSALYSDARHGDLPFVGSYDGDFDKTSQPAELELELRRQGYLTRPEFRFHEWKRAAVAGPVDTYTLGDEHDPRVRAAQYLAGNSRFLSATSLLEQVQAEAPQKRLPPNFYSDLAGDALSFGIPQQAEAIYRELVANATDPLALARGRLRLADFYYQRGYYNTAATELGALHEQLPRSLQTDWQDLESRVLLAQGRFGEAAGVLNQVDSAASTPYVQYNLAVALINDGRVGQGINLLDRVGRLSPTDSDSLALRDKANLTLGYHFLKTQQGGTAVPIFGRVRTMGPYSNKALLGLGWAFLAPHGSRQSKTEVGDEQPVDNTTFATIGVLLRPGYIDSDSVLRRAGLAPFRLSGRSADEEAQLKHALVPWSELASRDSIDPAVQEGLLAIPYVLDHLGAHIQAQQYYERAIASLEETRTLLNRAEYNVRSGRMVQTMVDNYDPGAESGWRWKLKSLPNAAETFYLQTLIADNNFQEELKDFRDTRLLQHVLAYWTARTNAMQQNVQTHSGQGVPAAPGNASNASAAAPAQDQAAELPDGVVVRMQGLRARIDTLLPQLTAAEKVQGALLQNIAITSLDSQKALNEKLLVETRFALARVYDSELKGTTAGDSK